MWKLVVVILLAAGGVVGWLLWKQNRPVPLVVSGFVEADQIRVGSRVGGRVAEVLVAEGQRVKKDDPLFRIEPFDLKEMLAQAEAQAEAKRQELAKLKAGNRPEEIAQATSRRDRLAASLAKAVAGPRKGEIDIAAQKLKVAQANLQLAESLHEQIMKMSEANSASQTEIDRATSQLKTARAEVLSAQQELGLLQEGTRAEDIAEAKAALAEAEAALKLMEEGYRKEEIDAAAATLAAAEAQASSIRKQLAELTVTSPGDCVVEAIDLRPGDLVAANAPAVSLLDRTRLWVRTYVPEGRLSKVKLDQQVPVRIDSLPNEKFIGRVSFIATEGEFTPRNIQTPEERSKQVFRIKLTLEEGLDRLHAGMMADVLLDQ